MRGSLTRMSQEDTDTTLTPGSDAASPAPTPSPEVAASPADTPRGLAAFDAWKKDVGDINEEHTKFLDELSPDSFKRFDPNAQVALRALDAHYTSRMTEAEAKAAERERAADAKEKALAEQARTLKQREAAMLAQFNVVKDPGAPPEVDPFSPEGFAAKVEHAAADALYKKMAPVRERSEELRREAEWERLTGRYPLLTDAKVSAEFDAWLLAENKGWDPSKGGPPPLSAQRGAELFFNKRELEALRAEQAKAVRADDQDRARAASMIGRSQGSGRVDHLKTYDQIRRANPEAGWAYLEEHPEAKAAWMRRNGQTAHA